MPTVQPYGLKTFHLFIFAQGSFKYLTLRLRYGNRMKHLKFGHKRLSHIYMPMLQLRTIPVKMEMFHEMNENYFFNQELGR